MKWNRGDMKRSKGFSLLEVLITMLVISVGILSLILLQSRALQFSQASYQRSVAVVQANDLVERLWVGVCSLPDSFDEIRDDWAAVNAQSLPEWTGSNSSVDNSVSPPLYTIAIEWLDERVIQDIDDENEPDQSFIFQARIPDIPC